MNTTAATRRGIIVLLVLLVLPLVHAVDVVVFERYDTTATIQDDTITIERAVRIRNVGQSPIIPGELHFKLYEQRGGERLPLAVSGLSATADTGESLGTRISERADETDLSVQLWNPLLPGFTYDFTMTYEMAFDPSGILFYEINLPREETTIPIRNEQTSFVLGDGYHVTYAPGSEVGTLSGNAVVSWTDSEDGRVVEYSRLPLPRTGVRAVNVFWILIILILAGFFALTIFRRRRAGGGGGPGARNQPQQNWQQQQQWQQNQNAQQWQQSPPGGWG